MKNILKITTLFLAIGLLFTACSSKKITPKVQKIQKIDTQKVKEAYKELDNEIQKNK
jgi:hypothetical protein